MKRAEWTAEQKHTILLVAEQESIIATLRKHGKSLPDL